MAGNIPDFAVNLISTKMPLKMNEDVVKNYDQLEKKGALNAELSALV